MSLERVVTVGVRTKESPQKFASLMEELRRLVETAGGQVVQEFFQNRLQFDPATLIGPGKLAEIRDEMYRLKIKTIVFDDDLTAAQQKNVEKMIKGKVIDRTRLILDIFAQRAHTREGQLQVELAQLNYMVPRLTGSWRGYSQQVGGIGTRGPGERKIEVERRYARERIKRLEVEIEDLKQHRHHTRRSRQDVPLPQIALIGYTNAGKSTLLNTLVQEKAVYADDKLFATLDPTTRRVKLPSGRTALFTDTVGFIQKLPTYLIAAFRSTLEEVTQASLLIHLIDVSAENWEEQEKTVLSVISDLGADHLPLLRVFNKTDVLSAARARSFQKISHLCISGQTGNGLNELLGFIDETLDSDLIEVKFTLPYNKRRLLSDVYKTGHVLSEKANRTGTAVHVRIDPGNWKRIEHQLKKKEVA